MSECVVIGTSGDSDSESYDSVEYKEDYALRTLRMLVSVSKGEEPVIDEADYSVRQEHEHTLESMKKGEPVSFHLFQIGGNGQTYSPVYVELMKELIQNGGKVVGMKSEVAWKIGANALMMAALHGDVSFMKFLVEYGEYTTEDLFRKNRQGNTIFDCYANGRSLSRQLGCKFPNE